MLTNKRKSGFKNLEKTYGKLLEKKYGKLTVGRILRAWRLCEDMSLKDFGKLIGISVSNLCDIEKGRKGISPEKAEQISKALKIPPALLIKLSIEKNLEAAGLKYKVEIKPST